MTQTAPVNDAHSVNAASDLEPLFAPRCIAVVGASRTPKSVGNAIMTNLVMGGYTGVVYPVNPKARSILGNRCVKRPAEIDDDVDLAVLVIPAQFIQGVVEDFADKGTRHFIVISAGFKEIGGEGVKREQALAALARERGLTIVGPNCLGIINTAPTIAMNATFARGMPDAGPFGLISQSGALCTALLDYAKGIGIGFSRFISFGNKAAVSETDLMLALAADPLTKAILMYVEELSHGQRFIETCHQITHGPTPKPIIIIKTGRTQEGAAAAASHTGSMAGSDTVYDAVLGQAGVLRVDSVKQLFDCAEGFIDPSLPQGRRTAVVTNAGGPGIMATDACIRAGMTLSRFQEYTLKSLGYQLPPTASLKNPVDVIGDAKHDRYRAALDAVSADEGVDQLMVIVTPQTMTDVTEIAEVVHETKSFCGKPIVGCLMGMVDVSAGVEILRKAGVPTYAFPEDAMRAMACKSRFAEWIRRPLLPHRHFEVDRDAVTAILDEERSAGRSTLVELKALEVFRHYGFPIVPFTLAGSADEAVRAADDLGFPVVLKISGPKIVHKTDVGGVRLNLNDADAVRQAFDEMIASVREKAGAEIEIWGVLVQKMLPAVASGSGSERSTAREIILGMSRSPNMGPLLMFGLGGIYTEALKDVSFRLAPIRENDASEMMRDIRSYKLLEGVRGEAPSDVAAVAECLLRLSQLVTEHAAIKELDINPLMVYASGQGAVVVDARIILSEE